MQIIAFRNKGKKKWKEIEAELGIDYQTCYSIYYRAKLYNSPGNRKRHGRPPIFSEQEKRRLEAFVTRDRLT